MTTTASTLISKLTVDPIMQARGSIDHDVVLEYAASMLEGCEFPAVSAVYDGERLWVWDGFHRIHASEEAGNDSIMVQFDHGTKRDAWMLSLGANSTHGLVRTREEKREAVRRAMADPQLASESDRALALICHVSRPFIADMRPKLLTKNAPDDDEGLPPGNVATPRDKPDTAPKNSRAVKPVATPTPTHTNEAGEAVSEAESLRERNAMLVEENGRLMDRLALHASEATEDEKLMMAEGLESLRAEVSNLTVSVRAANTSRDGYIKENAELKKQLKMQSKELDKLKGKR